MVESLSVRERELLDAIIAAQVAENAAAARKAAAIREFALLRAATLTSVGDVEPETVERKIVAEVAVACRVSPFQGRRRLHPGRHSLVERLTGQATAGDFAVEVQVLVPVEALLDPDSALPGQIAGHGPVPASTMRELVATTAGKKSLRRLVTRDGIVIGGDSRRRTFDGVLETFIRARDGNRCTAPYCDAPVRHIDHTKRWADGGRTEFVNGRGNCAFHNLAREPLRTERAGARPRPPRPPSTRPPSGPRAGARSAPAVGCSRDRHGEQTA